MSASPGETTGSLEEDLSGRTLGRWRLERRLGQGAMGPVYGAVSTGGTRGALHLVRGELTQGEDGLARFRRDSRSFQKVEHPNLPRLVDVDEDQGRVFVVFELVEGRSLQVRLDRKERLSPEEALHVATDLLSGLAVLHDRGIVHGDVKPASLLTTPEGYWKLAGFSLTSAPDAASKAPAGVIRGTPLFLAPERAQGPEGTAGTPAADLYSAGATIHAALAGEPPFLRPSVAAILEAHAKDEAPELASKAPGADPDLLTLVRALMAKTPAQRPPDARTALAVLGHRPRPRSKPQSQAQATDAAGAPAASPGASPGAGPAAGPEASAANASPDTPAAPPPPPGTKTTRRLAHEYVLAQEKLAGPPAPGRVPWWSIVVLPTFGGALAYLAAHPDLVHAAPSARGPLLVAAAALALLGVAVGLLGAIPAGVKHHARAHRLVARIPLRLTAWWNRRRDPVRAGLALADLGDVSAGEVLLESGEALLAAEEFLRAGIPHAAALVFEKLGDSTRAIEAYMAASQLDDAARVASQAGRLEEAGEAFERAGLVDRAIQAYARAGSPLKLAVLHERHGKPLEAAKHYELAGEHAKAAELFQKAGHTADAARLFHRSGDLARVAQVWEAAGDPVNAARWSAERELAEGRLGNAARAFERAGLHGRAADLYLAQDLLADAQRCAEADGEPGRRALIHARKGELREAAALHEKAGQHAEAARCWRELGDPASEARALENAGDPLEAAEAWIHASRLEDARRALGRVPRESQDRRRALGRLGELEARAGRPREAAAALREALDGQEPSADNVGLIVECADALAASGELDAAVERLEALRGLPFAPPTLKIRLAELEARRRPAPAAQEATLARAGKELVGQELDRYRALSYTGEGELSWAFEGEHVLLERGADLRVLKTSVEGPQARRFFAEAAALAVARHPNLPLVYDSGKTEAGLAYAALEVASDPTLRQVLRQAAGPLPTTRASRLGAGILAGLVAAHRAGVVHGDLRPESVLVGPFDHARVTGFAFSRFSAATTGATLAIVQRRPYGSPEQLDGLVPGPASDQYAAGIVLYEMLAGEHPLPPTAPGAQPAGSPRPLAEAAPRVPATLANAVMKALDRRPAERHASVQDFLKIVARFAPPP